jgi:hypothetical protein
MPQLFAVFDRDFGIDLLIPKDLLSEIYPGGVSSKIVIYFLSLMDLRPLLGLGAHAEYAAKERNSTQCSVRISPNRNDDLRESSMHYRLSLFVDSGSPSPVP